MIKIFSTIINYIQILLLFVMGMLGISVTIFEFIGIGKIEKMLSKMGFSNIYNRILVVGYIMLGVFLLTCFIKAKCFPHE